MKSIERIYDFAVQNKCEALKNVPMSEYTSFKIGGPADIILMPENAEKMKKVFAFCKQEEIEPFVLGNGSNLLVSDEGIRGVVIYTGRMTQIELTGELTIRCDAGQSLSRLCNFALDNSLAGLEFAFGIPGSVGGAAHMNAGAYGGEMKDVILSCTHITPEGEIVQAPAASLGFSYRRSVYSSNGCLIASIDIGLIQGCKQKIKSTMMDIIEKRRAKQPLEFPSAGSVFKRPEGYFAGALIEQCGLKGRSVGGAQLSSKHAGFIVNRGGATCEDVKKLIDIIKENVFNRFGVILETEIKIV